MGDNQDYVPQPIKFDEFLEKKFWVGVWDDTNELTLLFNWCDKESSHTL
jgi:hypothetical protein